MVAFALLLGSVVLRAHSGPPYPIVSDRAAGPYVVSIWTDPDATDDRSAAGKFWVTIDPANRGTDLPEQTRARVTIRALDRTGDEQSGAAEPVNRQANRQFVALLMDHEGPFSVSVHIDGPLGAADVSSQADATYDARPSPFMLVLALVPFLLAGGLWLKVLLRRRALR